MDSGTLGVNDNDSDLSVARERLRWGVDSKVKVYTRKNFRKKIQLEISNNDSATTTPSAAAAAAAAATDECTVATQPTADTKPTSSSPAKDDLATNGSALRPLLEETLGAKDGHFPEKQQQPAPSRSEGEPSTSDGARQLEDDSRGVEAVSNGGEGPTSRSAQEVRESLPDGQEATSSGGEEPPLSNGREAPSGKGPPLSSGREAHSGGEGPPLSSGGEAHSGGERPPLSSGREAHSGGEGPPLSSGGEAHSGGEEPPLSSGREAHSGEEPPLSSGREAHSGEGPPLSSGREAHSGGEGPPLSSGREAHSGGEAPPLSSGREAHSGGEAPPLSSGREAHSGGEAPPLSSGREAHSGGEEPPLSSGREAHSGGEGPPLTSGREADGGGEEPALSSGREAPSGGEEPPLSSRHEGLHHPLPNGGQDTVSNREELQSAFGNGPESLSELQHTGQQKSLPDNREKPPVGDQPEVAAGQEAAAGVAKGREEVQLTLDLVTVPSDEGSHAPGVDRPVNGVAFSGLVNGLPKPMITRVEDRVRINISGSPKVEMRKLKRKLENELDHVRSIVEKIQVKELQVSVYNASNVNINSRYIGGSVGHLGSYGQPQLVRANSELGAVGHLYSRPQLSRVNSEVGSVGYQETRPFRNLSVSVMENNHGVGEFVEKEKRTPKANQFYRNSEFLLGKDRLPPESNKKLKLNCGGKKHGGNAEYVYGYGYQNRDKVFKSCSNLLQRLMKHKHAWVFNEPVDAKKLNIPDYHIIIKHPMDFGTIKSRLAENWYKSAREFAEDVRLVFRNAMTYNPKGQDVYVMAEELSNIFEEKWLAIEKEYYPYQIYYDAGLPIPTPRKAPPPPVFTPVPAHILAPVSAPPMRTLDRSESMTMPVYSRLKPSNSHLPHGGRTPVPKKPKAKDPNKRDMTYEEKQKLSTNLQSLPPEKLDAIVQIIKKRNTALSQHDDEIEVDIDNVDAETLWELDRFVTNYKKSLSKNKRKAELALQRKAAAAQAVQATNPVPTVVEAQTESRTGEQMNPPVVEVEKQGDNVSGSSSSSSSSSDSGSSSSDSDSDSSSAYGSDAGHSPKT